MLQALFRLLGVELDQKLAEVRGQLEELKRSAISQATEQVKETGLTVGLMLGGRSPLCSRLLSLWQPSMSGSTCTKGPWWRLP